VKARAEKSARAFLWVIALCESALTVNRTVICA